MDRRIFGRFIGLLDAGEGVPDASTIWLFWEPPAKIQRRHRIDIVPLTVIVYTELRRYFEACN